MSDFFLNMPRHATAYAMPLKYADKGYEKRGRNGTVHQWALERLAFLKGSLPGRVITVFLNDNTDVVAARDGRPLMSSHGYSDHDGIMARSGCGAIDTSIVFQLSAAGYSPERIDQILSRESGFTALAGAETGLAELLVRDTPGAAMARDIFSYQLLKAIGACAAVLEGADSIVFIGEGLPEIRDWSQEFLGELEFLGFKACQDPVGEGAFMMASGVAADAWFFDLDQRLLM